MSNIPPIEDGYIDQVIKSSGPLKPNLNKTQGVELRALVKLLRDRLEGEISEHYTASQTALSQKANVDQVVLKTTRINGKPLSGDVALDKTDIGLGNVDNTADVDKPLSNFAQAALALKADMASVNDALSTKVDKVLGKQLSTEDFSNDDKNKLGGIQNGATSNQSDAYLLARENHTGSQDINTINGLRAELDTKINQTEKGQGNGIATLDGTGKIPLSQLNEALLGSVNYQGNYNAAINNPVLPVAANSKGKYYVVSVAGNQQGLELNIGDWIISNGTAWERVDNNNKVTSVNGKLGAVTLGKGDIGLGSADNTSDLAKPVSLAQQAALDGKANSNGSNAAGIWGIDVSGNAATVSILNSSQIFTALNGSNLGSNTLNVNVFGRSAYSDRLANGSADMAFHWQGQAGQPNWLWGGNDPNDMYVYNPANFSVQNAAQWNGVSVNWNDDSGVNLNDVIGIDANTGIASRYNASYIKNWLGLDGSYQPLENQRLSNTNAVQFQSVFLNEYVSTPKIDFRGVSNPSFIQGNGEYIDIRPSSAVRFLSITDNDSTQVEINAREGHIFMRGLLTSSNINNSGNVFTNNIGFNGNGNDPASIDKIAVGVAGNTWAHWATPAHFKNNVLGLGSAAYLNANSAHTAVNQVVTRDVNATMGAEDIFVGVKNAYVSALLDGKANVQYLTGTRDMNDYLPSGLYEIESAGGVISNTPVGGAQASNFSYMSIGSSSRNFQMMTGYGTTDVYVRSRVSFDGLNYNFSTWERLVKSSELSNAAYLNASGGNDAIQVNTVVKYNSSGFIRTLSKDYPQHSGITSLYGAKGEDDFLWAFNSDAVKAFLNYNGSQIYSDVSNIEADIQVAKYMRWKQHGNGHVIFDASAGTSPNGTVIDRNNPQAAADGTVNPVLMGWNGISTYGVRVDSARLADSASNTDEWAGLNRTAGIIESANISYLHVLNAIGDNSGFADRSTIKSWLGLNTDQDPTFRNIASSEIHSSRIWSFYGEGSVNGYSWTDAAVTTTSIEIVTGGGANTYTDKSPTLAFHRYGSGGPQFRLDPTGTNVLYLESANVNSARNGAPYGGGANSYFNKLEIAGGLKVNSTLELPSSTINAFLVGTGDNATYDIHNFKLKGWWGLGLQGYDDVVRGVYDFRRGLWDTESGYKVHSNIHMHSPRFGVLGDRGSQLNYAQGQIVLGGHFLDGAYQLPTDSVNNGGALITSDIFGTVRLTTIASIGNGMVRNIDPNLVNDVSKIFTFGTNGVFTSDSLSTGNIYLGRGQEALANIDKFAVGQNGDNVVRWTPISSIVNTLGLQGGGYNDATRLQSTTHAGTFWLENNWDGTYWQLNSNHGSPVNVGRANSSGIADSANYINSMDGSRQPNEIYPQNNPKRVRFDFAQASNVGVGGNYAGVMTYSPWDGTTAGTGDASYQLIFGSTAVNGNGVPQLRIRKGIDSSWKEFYDIYTSADINRVKTDLGLSNLAYSNIDLNNFVQGQNGTRTNEASDFNAALSSGFYNYSAAANAPTAEWYHLITSRHTNPSVNYQMQIAGQFFNDNQFYIRTIADGDAHAWKRITTDERLGTAAFQNGASNGDVAGTLLLSDGNGVFRINDIYIASKGALISTLLDGKLASNSGLQTVRNNGAEVWSETNTSTSYYDAALQIRESQNGGSSGFLAPRLAFHWGGVAASQITIEGDGRIAIMNNPGTGYGNFIANNVYGANDVSANYTYGQVFTSGGRIWTGYDSGLSGSVSASNWFRSNGNTGWYNETYAGGIYMEDTVFVRTHNGKGFYAGGRIKSDTTIEAFGELLINKNGNYSTITFPAQTNDPGFIRHYESNNQSRMEFSVSDDSSDQDYFSFGTTQSGNWSESARITSNGRVYAATGTDGGFGNFTYQQNHNNIWRLHSDPEYGLGYYQNWAPAGNLDAIGFHFGDRNNPAFFVRTDGEVHIGNGKAAASLVMHDNDQTTRILHTNGNRIGFLNAGGGWGAYCENDGSWRTDNEFRVGNTTLNGSGLIVTAGNGNGISFWNSGFAGDYSIWMGDTNAYGGNISGDGDNDYNMYFRMSSLNRGFVFRTGNNQNTLQVTNNKVTVNGAVSASGGFYDTSDINLKTIVDSKFDVSAIGSIAFKWKEGDDKVHYGYSAQEVQKVMPDAVRAQADGTLSVNYTEVLVAKINMLEEEIRTLKSKLN